MKTIKQSLSMLMALLLVCATGIAAADAPVRISNTAMKQVIEVNDKGEREVRYVEPKTVIPGDVILYTIEFENIGDQPISNIVLNDPVPNNSFYRDGSAKGENADILFSVDGENFAPADKLTVTENGKQRKATAKDYTVVRWVVKQPLKPGEKRSVSFKTQIRKPGE